MEPEISTVVHLVGFNEPVIPIRWTRRGLVFCRVESWGSGGSTECSWRLIHPKDIINAPESLIKLIGEPPVKIKIPKVPKVEPIAEPVVVHKPEAHTVSSVNVGAVAIPVKTVRPPARRTRRTKSTLDDLGVL